MTESTLRVALAVMVTVITLDAAAQSKPIAYPAKGQSAHQQQSDDGACYSRAKSNTCIDLAVAFTAPPPRSGPAVGGGERLGGAERGAAAGAVIGASAGDAGKGAAIGATAGTIAGGVRARQNRRTQDANAQGATSTYYRA
ncbi:glycine zipper family protein [Caballeronia sp. ATUFL_M1_KS5A]|uniref:glycine zipper domain-containing protein n=1 Tax=Caballeronia sp. ATUFL_M1_KS5A TaxID=2921778 RepID=UPI0020296223|nr:glycine zipper family protein [Caballeronia sp. ATUFL_M1_KS5A]